MEPGFETFLDIPDLLPHGGGDRDLAGKREGIVTERHIDAALAIRGRFFNRHPVALGFAPALYEFLKVLVLGASAPQGWDGTFLSRRSLRGRRRRHCGRCWRRSSSRRFRL